MVPQSAPRPGGSLRAITQRLSSTPTKQLSRIVSYMANSLIDCKDVLSIPDSQRKAREGSEAAVLVHKYKTQVSTLLQDKSKEGRWSAVVLIKATIEVGGWEILQGAGAWTRGLLAILGKPDPPNTKKLCIIALTRIFVLTQGHQTITRELTTPSLPTFITSCLNLVSDRAPSQDTRRPNVYSPLLETVLQCLIELLPHHPASFRPFVPQIRTLLLPLLAPTPSHVPVKDTDGVPDQHLEVPSSSAITLSQNLFNLLPSCAPKNTSNEDWSMSGRVLIAHIHRTADLVFRAVLEDRQSSTTSRANIHDKSIGNTVSDGISEGLALPSWRGIHAGSERLIGLLQLLQTYIATAVSSSVNLSVGNLIGVTERTLSILAPARTDQQGFEARIRLNPEVGREEREGLWLGLTEIHIAAIGVLSMLISRLGDTSMTIGQGVLERLLWVFQSEKENDNIRIAIYEVVTQILPLVGPSLTRSTVSSLSPLIRTSCEDLLIMDKTLKTQHQQSANGGARVSTTNGNAANDADSYLKPPITTMKAPETLTDVQITAQNLLPLFFTKIRTELLSPASRGVLDRTAILVKHKEAMLASVLNPPIGKGSSSIIPLLARAFPTDLEVEGILRPRMPLMRKTRDENGDAQTDEEMVDIDERYDYKPDASTIPSYARSRPTDDMQHVGDGPIQQVENTTHSTKDRKLLDTAENILERRPQSGGESSKRPREVVDEQITTEPVAAEYAGIPSDMDIEPLQKRVHMDVTTSSIEHVAKQEVSAIDVPVIAATGSNAKAAPSSTTAKNGALASDSEESDFEIPPLYLDSDSEEDDEEDPNEKDDE